jgi:C-terminal processing protease CtpA/Prc
MTVAFSSTSVLAAEGQTRSTKTLRKITMSNLTTALALRATRGLILFTSVIEDSRAFRAGIHPIDLITHINYRSVHGMTPDQAVEEMGGAPAPRSR